jgi:Protein of unknown function (DUF2971)
MPVADSLMPGIPNPPSDEATIWRFMDYPKFFSMITERRLHLAQIAILRTEDPFEGHETDKLKEIIKRINVPGFAEGLSKVFFGDSTRANYLKTVYGEDNFIKELDRKAHTTYANCWHVNEHESAALWRLYTQDGAGVAIKSSISKLRESLVNSQENIHVGSVEYIDYEHEFIGGNGYQQFFSKRKSFEHEKELRICVITHPYQGPDDISLLPKNLSICCDITKLIDKIYISPHSPFWHLKTIQAIAGSFNIDAEIIIKSGMLSKDLR